MCSSKSYVCDFVFLSFILSESLCSPRHSGKKDNSRWPLSWLLILTFIICGSFYVVGSWMFRKRQYKFLMWSLERHHPRGNLLFLLRICAFVSFRILLLISIYSCGKCETSHMYELGGNLTIGILLSGGPFLIQN